MMRAYDAADARFYDYYSLGLPGDVEFYVDEARQTRPPVLELGCGTGRLLDPLARAGVRVVGLDQSPAMLARARKRLARLDARTRRRCTLVRGDMRDFSLGRRFDLILIPYRGFLHLLTPDDQRRALLTIRGHLAEGGRLILDIFDPRPDVIAAHAGPLGAALKKDDEFIHPETKRHVIVYETRQYDPATQLLEQDFIFEELQANGRMVERTISHYLLRYVHRWEMQYLLELCGYEVESLYGDFQRRPFRAGGEQIWVARRGRHSA